MGNLARNTSLWRIAGGTIYDPRHGINGQVGDLWIDEKTGRIVEPPADAALDAAKTLDARGLVVMPGGVDMHCHIAGPKVNVARKMRPEEKRDGLPWPRRPGFPSGTRGSVPTTFVTGYQYAGLGYTTAFDAAVPPLVARHAHEEFADTPSIDAGFYVLMGNHHYALEAIRDQDPERLRAFVGWLVRATGAYGAKLVNPGGVEMWKQHPRGDVATIDTRVDQFGVTPRQIIHSLATAVDELSLPHSVHIHSNHLGMPGNWHTTLQTMQALEGRRGHLTHIQFHSYAGKDADEATFGSRVAPLADYVNSHPEITVDVGQVLFGKTTSMTGDGPVGYYLSRIYGSKWFSADTELEAGCGIAPIEYRRKSLVHAWQWAIGLEWYLLMQDPWRIAMSTDHPNGGSFLAYPHIIRLLMDREYRREMLSQVHPEVRQHSVLADLDREYSLYEIAIITRAAPARMLGLQHKGHLGPGADADVTLYTPDANREIMFGVPRYVIQRGRLVIEEGEFRTLVFGQTQFAEPEFDPGFLPDLRTWFERNSTIRWANFPVSDDYLHRAS